jgi:hypothetical protein
MKLRRFQISAKLFWGFQTSVDVETASTEALILDAILESLRSFLSASNLLALVDEARNLRLHLHDSIDSILAKDNETFYACDYICFRVAAALTPYVHLAPHANHLESALHDLDGDTHHEELAK